MVMTSSRPPGVAVMRVFSTSSTTPTGEALQQRDALAQRRLELDFAAHRALGDPGDMGLEAGEIGQFVDAFLADHGGIHVGQKKLLAPESPGLHDNVDRQITARLAQAVLDGPDVVVAASKGISTATSSNSHCAGPAEGRMARAPSTTVLSSAGSAGLQISVATRDIRVASRWKTTRRCLSQGRPPAASRRWRCELAQRTGGVVINADSMQVYRDLRVLTARPTLAEEARAPHRLYGHVDAAVNFSAGSWVADAANVLAELRAENRLPIFAGGSGLYRLPPEPPKGAGWCRRLRAPSW